MGETNRGVVMHQPHFDKEAQICANKLATMSLFELKETLHVNDEIAKENLIRYKYFADQENRITPAILAYQGVVYQHIGAASMSQDQLNYADKHLLITSFLYGLLRPLDGIKPYRLEGNTVIDKQSRFNYWKPILTDYLINEVKKDDGVLINLASNEMKKLFDWKKISKELDIVTPEFKTMKNGKMKSIVIHTKMSRGDMTKFILNNQINNKEDLSLFEPSIPNFQTQMFLK